jgi:hypothetical protein
MKGTIVQTTDTFTMPRTIEGAMRQFDRHHGDWEIVEFIRQERRRGNLVTEWRGSKTDRLP